MGGGFVDSVRFIHDTFSPALQDVGLNVALSVVDDRSDTGTSLELARRANSDPETVCIVGPCDTGSVQSIVDDQFLWSIPVFISLATGSRLTAYGAPNLFRFTTPDRDRAILVVRRAVTLYPNKCVHVFTLEGPPEGYSQQLRVDVLAALQAVNCPHVDDRMFGMTSQSLSTKVPSHEPIILCGPSRAVITLAESFRSEGVRSQMFTFGSHTNLLTPVMIGAETVADLDRDDADPRARDIMERFSKVHKSPNPSMATMNSVAVILNLLKRLSTGLQQEHSSIKDIRQKIIDDCHTNPQQGLFQEFTFRKSGDMIGPERLCLLHVKSSVWHGCRFSYLPPQKGPEPSFKPILNKANKIYLALAGLIGLLASLGYFWDRFHQH
jgi:ABC-type branched-subunit amino acid transport system substrate-binding protein